VTQITGTLATSATGATGALGGTAATSAIDPEKKKVAQQFEAIFLRQMLGSMRSANLGDGMFDSSATEQFQSMADANTADAMSKTGSFGIADLLIKQFGWDKTSSPAAASPATALRSIAAVENSAAASTAATMQAGETP